MMSEFFLWQMSRRCEPSFMDLSVYLDGYSPEMVHCDNGLWIECPRSLNQRLSQMTSDDVEKQVCLRDGYQSTKYVIKRVEAGDISGCGPYVMIQHTVLPELVICKPVRPLVIQVTFQARFGDGDDDLKAHIRIGVHSFSSYKDAMDLVLQKSDTPRFVHDTILHWVRMTERWPVPEFRLTFRIYVGGDLGATEVLNQVPDRSLGAMRSRHADAAGRVAANMAPAVALARPDGAAAAVEDDNDDWVIPSSSPEDM